ncbi:uncharacterized protein LOC135265575 [Tribolium castaneum]|uniref:Uncharacterized protein n=1 Tax=Tribolium castaneum TaxID=7070 RepID=A0A139W9D1_TRICA|nr:hypothetical protein TcasGA2_TC031849 [Tribolium castaneum]
MPGKRVSSMPLKKSSPKRFKAPGDGGCVEEEEISASQVPSVPKSSLSAFPAASPPPPPPSQSIELARVSEIGLSQAASPKSPQPIHAEEDIITPAEWSDPVLERSLMEMADNIEKNEAERSEKDEAERTARMVINEKFRLIHEVVYPITKSGSKLLSIGVKPLHDFVPLLKIHNPELTSAISFSIETFEEFLKEMSKIFESREEEDEEVEEISVPEGQMLCMLSGYVVVVCRYNTLQFIPSQPSVYKGIYLSLNTIKTVVNMGEHLLNLLHARRIQYKFYPCYDSFINNVALDVMENGCKNLSQKLYDIIKNRYEQNATLYEIVLKLPMNVKTAVEGRIQYYRENNDYNCL